MTIGQQLPIVRKCGVGGCVMTGEISSHIFQRSADNIVIWTLPIIGAVLWAIIKLIGAQLLRLRDFWTSRTRALTAVARKSTPNGPQEGSGVWTLSPVTPPENYKTSVQNARILSIVNLKGGVGKTTIAANVAAHLGNHPSWRKRVLLVDLDYQGSLSSMAFPDDISWIPTAGTDSIVTRAISGDLEPNLFVAACKEIRQEPRVRVATAYYDLAQAENRLLIEWLLNVHRTDDRSWGRWISDLFIGKIYQANEMRFNLARLLHSQSVQDAFDLIIIDCPPRLTAGTIQALCASSHVLIPTILDKPSGESVVSFCDQLEIMRKAGLCPFIRHIGVVATRYDDKLNVTGETIKEIRDDLQARKFRCGFVPQMTFIPNTVRLVRRADEGIAYFSLAPDASPYPKRAIGKLARHIANQVGVPPAQPFDDELDDNQQLSLPVAAE